MTQQEADDLARRAVACPRWRWMPGMHDDGGCIVVRTSPILLAIDEEGCLCTLTRHTWPDLTDPATLGCLLALVREAYRDPFAHVGRSLGDWIIWATPPDRRGSYAHGIGETEAEALIAALEAAP